MPAAARVRPASKRSSARFKGLAFQTGDGWTTPDAFAGSVGDPMSMKPYMWNRNDPYQYNDPSGYFWESISGIPAEALYKAFESADPSLRRGR